MANPAGPPAASQDATSQDAASQTDRSMFWIVFWGALAALFVMEVIEGVIDYLM